MCFISEVIKLCVANRKKVGEKAEKGEVPKQERPHSSYFIIVSIEVAIVIVSIKAVTCIFKNPSHYYLRPVDNGLWSIRRRKHINRHISEGIL